jgi:hypothetical protein
MRKPCAWTPDHETRQLLHWLAADVKYLLAELDKHAAPVVDMTKGGVLHIPVLPINGQDDADLAAILAVRDRKKKRTPL